MRGRLMTALAARRRAAPWPRPGCAGEPGAGSRARAAGHGEESEREGPRTAPGGATEPGGADGALPMNIFEMGALLRRHFIAVLAVLVLALWLVHDFKATPMVWNASATSGVNPPRSQL